MNNKEWAFCDGICEKDILRYGEIILDEVYDTWDGHTYRLRAIRYEGKLYWHKMVDGKLMEFRGVKIKIGSLSLGWAARFPRRGPSLLNNSHIC